MMDKRLLALVPEAMRHVIATVLWQWVGLFGNVALVWIIARALSALVMGQTVPAWMPVLLAVGIVARTIAARMGAHSSFAASQDVKRVLRRRIYQKLLALGPNYTEQVPTAEVVQLSVEGCEQLETYATTYSSRGRTPLTSSLRPRAVPRACTTSSAACRTATTPWSASWETP